MKYLSVFGAASMIDSIFKWYPSFLKENIPNATIVVPQQPTTLIDAGLVSNYHRIDIQRKPSISKDLMALLQLFLFVRKHRFELIHSFMPKAGFITAIVVFLSRVTGRKITHVHTFTGLVWTGKSGLKQRLASLPDLFIAKVANISVTESIGVANELKTLGKNINPIIIGCGNIAGVDVSYFYPQTEPSSRVSNKLKTFVYVGRVAVDKGIFDLLSLFDLELELCFNLVVVGGCELSETDMIRFNQYLVRFPSRITYVGLVDDIRPYVVVADFFIFASKREGFPNVILQSMAMGIPVISSKVHGIEDILKTVDTKSKVGFFFDVGSQQGLLACILDAIKILPDDYIAMSNTCTKTISSHFSQKNAYEGLKKFYASLGVY